VEDSVVLLDAIAGWDRFDSTSIDGPVPNLGGSLTKGVDGLRIGLVKELVGDGIDPDVLAATRAMADKLESAGASVAEASLPSSEYALSAYYLIAPAECSSNLARFDGVRYGHRSDVEGNTEEMMSHSRAEGFGPEVIRRILLGTYALSAGYYDAFYGQAQRVRTLVRHDFAAAYAAFDVLISPTSPTTAFKVGERAQDPIAMYYSDVCTIPSNLSGDPSISLPVGLDSEGLPIGFQIMAPALGEEVMYQVAAEVERLAGFTERAALATSEVTTP
jgi:aspartyl-tRNA(Asn)/glutamyl-tRNA(Gln) amidotransferase subunit A